jgi:cobalt-zinc-cadmium efflux system membrane fusion protein
MTMRKIVLALSLLVLSCSDRHSGDSGERSAAANDSLVAVTAQQARNAGIVLGTPREGTLSERITLRGTIELPPQNRITLTFPIGGVVRTIAVLPGQYVRRGQTIATIEGMQLIELQEQYLSTRVAAEQADREYQRQRVLAESKATSDRVLREAEALARQRRIALVALAERLRLVGLDPDRMSDTTIAGAVVLRSPAEGYVASVNVSTGQTIAADYPIVELVDVRDVHLVLRAFQRELPLLRPGQRVIAAVGDRPDDRYAAEIVTIGHTFDSSRSVEVHCHFERYDHERLRPGMYASAEVTIEHPRGYVLGSDAVVVWDNRRYVFAPSDGGYRTIEVSVRAERADSVLVVPVGMSALPERIVVRGAYWLLMKLKNTGEEE